MNVSDLTVTIRIDTSEAIQQLKKLIDALEAINQPENESSELEA